MKALLVENETLVMREVEEPVPREDEVIVEVFASALNRADILQRHGKYPSPKGCPSWPGLEIAGVIKKMGREAEEKSRFKTGDKVCALLGGGGYAEYAAVPYTMLMPVPRGLSMEEAAALPEAFATCYLNLFGEGRFKCGETLFFPAGASGLASVGIPMAKAFGAYVITSVLDEEKKREIAHLGADVVVNTAHEDVIDVIAREAENGHPIDVAIDCLAGDVIGRAFPYVNEGCRWVLISTLAGTETTVPLRAVLTKGIEFKGSMLRKRSAAEKSAILGELVEKIWPKIEEGKIRPTIYKVMRFDEANEAHAIIERGENVGKVVLKVR